MCDFLTLNIYLLYLAEEFFFGVPPVISSATFYCPVDLIGGNWENISGLASLPQVNQNSGGGT